MSKPFNNLSNAQAERLAMLIEECAEVTQAATKILRHGYMSYHPKRSDRSRNNRTDLTRELADLEVAIDAMNRAHDYDFMEAGAFYKIKATSNRYTHHQGESS